MRRRRDSICGIRSAEYQGYLSTVQDLRRTLTAQLAEWYAGDRSDLRAGAVLGVAIALAALRYGRSVEHEIRLVRKPAHLRNRRAGRSCSCGTTRGCSVIPGPHERHLDFLLERFADDTDSYNDEEDFGFE